MNDSEYNELRTASWRRRLAPAEEARVNAYLAAHPEGQNDWEEDLALTRQLQELPDVPVPSNFTSLVLQAIDAERVQQSGFGAHSRGWQRWLKRLTPRLAFAALALSLGATSLWKYEQIHTRKQVAAAVERFVKVTNLPGPEVLEDFDAIQQLQAVSFSTDNELLAALR
jgi:anti-sigma factor RsiW